MFNVWAKDMIAPRPGARSPGRTGTGSSGRSRPPPSWPPSGEPRRSARGPWTRSSRISSPDGNRTRNGEAGGGEVSVMFPRQARGRDGRLTGKPHGASAAAGCTFVRAAPFRDQAATRFCRGKRRRAAAPGTRQDESVRRPRSRRSRRPSPSACVPLPRDAESPKDSRGRAPPSGVRAWRVPHPWRERPRPCRGGTLFSFETAVHVPRSWCTGSMRHKACSRTRCAFSTSQRRQTSS